MIAIACRQGLLRGGLRRELTRQVNRSSNPWLGWLCKPSPPLAPPPAHRCDAKLDAPGFGNTGAKRWPAPPHIKLPSPT